MRQRYIIDAFATGGDKTPDVPDAADPDGFVSWSIGFTFDYQRNLLTDPDAKSPTRINFNAVLFDISSNVQQYQQSGYPEFITSANNGGSAFSYNKNSAVLYSAGGSPPFDLYLSLVDSNTTTPPSSNWLNVASNLQRGQNYALYQLVAGVQSVSVNGAAFTTSGAGTFVVPANGSFYVEIAGSGGGGGGSGVSGDDSIPSAGGGGEFAKRTFNGQTGSLAVVIGAMGTAGTSGVTPTNGTDGGDTTIGSTLFTAKGGKHGVAKVGSGPASASGSSGSGSGAGFRVTGGSSSVGTLIPAVVLLGSFSGNCNAPGSQGEISATGGTGNGQGGQFPGGGGGAGVGGGTSVDGASGYALFIY